MSQCPDATTENAVNKILEDWKDGKAEVRNAFVGQVMFVFGKPADEYERHFQCDTWVKSVEVALHDVLNVVCHGDARTRLPLTPGERDDYEYVKAENDRLRTRLCEIAGFPTLPPVLPRPVEPAT